MSRHPPVWTGGLDELGREALHPSVDSDVIDRDATFGEQQTL